MHLNEIKTLRTSQLGRIVKTAIALSDNPNRPHTNLGMLGGRELGSGVMGSVHARPPKKGSEGDNSKHVYKAYGNDSAYHAYISYARKNQDNPHVPKILGAAKIASNKEGTRHLHVVKMERLEPLHPNHPIRDLTSDSWGGRIYKNDMNTVLSKLETDQGNRLKVEYPHFHKVLSDLANRHAEDGFDMDLHMGNVMQRHDGTPVITDPMIRFGDIGDRDQGNPLSLSSAAKEKHKTFDSGPSEPSASYEAKVSNPSIRNTTKNAGNVFNKLKKLVKRKT